MNIEAFIIRKEINDWIKLRQMIEVIGIKENSDGRRQT
jgi:hypothetical protein|tara:strand:- start:631 stop:744 length:114 start_codon:yes stop_codon:yes gene_type:complete